MERKLIVTDDGSHTLLVPQINEHYHSTHGAIQESQHVYIDAGLKPLLKNESPISIFEMGFGTGLNALLTLLTAYDSPMDYTTVEAYPLLPDEIASLNYAHQLKGNAHNYYKTLHQAAWNEKVNITPYFTLHKIHNQLSNLHFADESFDLVYYDAFAPAVQPELWTLDVFARINKWVKPNGILVTYCAQGELKRNLKSLGFEVMHLPGPPGKRVITKAVKTAY